jgi:hypothetical protein
MSVSKMDVRLGFSFLLRSFLREISRIPVLCFIDPGIGIHILLGVVTCMSLHGALSTLTLLFSLSLLSVHMLTISITRFIGILFKNSAPTERKHCVSFTKVKMVKVFWGSNHYLFQE